MGGWIVISSEFEIQYIFRIGKFELNEFVWQGVIFQDGVFQENLSHT